MERAMRDIRADLKERLAFLDGRYADEVAKYDQQRDALEAAYRESIQRITRERSAIADLLAIENERAIEPLAVERPKLAPLMEFLLAKVCAHGPVDKDQLRAETNAAGYFDEGNGRAFHTTLMNITRGGKVIQLPDGRYAAPTTPGNLFNPNREGNVPTIM
jgi:hypothetical protein